MFIILLFFVGEGISIGGNLILVTLTENVTEGNITGYTQLNYLLYYGCVTLALAGTFGVSNIGAFFRLVTASVRLHDDLVTNTMHAPLAFFESNPSGRLLNRFLFNNNNKTGHWTCLPFLDKTKI